jgi:hypothetical protein
MDNSALVVLIIAASSNLVAIAALVLSHRGFAAIDSRFASLDGRFEWLENRFDPIDGRFAALEGRLDLLQLDMKNLNQRMMALRRDVALIKDKPGR